MHAAAATLVVAIAPVSGGPTSVAASFASTSPTSPAASASTRSSPWGDDLLAARGRGLDSFHALGFSRAGRFAYVVVGCGDEAGYTCWSAAVVDLRTDRTIEVIAADDARRGADDDEDARAALPAAFAVDVERLLARHGIDRVAQPRVVEGARFVDEQRFAVRLATRTTPHPIGDAPARATTVSLVRDGATKRLGALLTGGGPLDAGDLEPLGVVVSPFERRAAVLVLEPYWGGCVGGRWRVHVVGADLDARFR